MKRILFSIVCISLISALSVCLTLSLCLGCSKKQPHGSSDKDVSSTSKRRVNISKGSQSDWGYNTCEGAIKQPNFTSVIDREGAIVTFDAQGYPVHGITARTYDPELKKEIQIRELTREELDAASSLLRRHFREFMDQGIRTVVVHCNDLKQAAEEALTNTRPTVDYWMEADIHTGLCQVFKQKGDAWELIASEKIYYPKQ